MSAIKIPFQIVQMIVWKLFRFLFRSFKCCSCVCFSLNLTVILCAFWIESPTLLVDRHIENVNGNFRTQHSHSHQTETQMQNTRRFTNCYVLMSYFNKRRTQVSLTTFILGVVSQLRCTLRFFLSSKSIVIKSLFIYSSRTMIEKKRTSHLQL